MTTKERRPHVLAVPFPAQGHVMPLMRLCRKIAKRGVRVTFVNAEHLHENVVAGMSDEDENIELIAISDGLQTEEERKRDLLESLRKTLPGKLADVIEEINSENNEEKISCLIADTAVGWILDVTAHKKGIEPVAFQFGSAADLALVLQTPELIRAGILDTDGSIINNETIKISDEIPPWGRNELPWSIPANLKAQETTFKSCLATAGALRRAKWLLCNTFYELESSACDLIPNHCPVGPLLSDNYSSKSCASVRSLWVEDTTCLSWLDKQPVGSVIYVAFGSLVALSDDQLTEVASALELSGRPFLWVIRSNLSSLNVFFERVGERGKIVEWAPQEKVLAHSSVGCFLSHCGWNSTSEGLSMGVPFLCWPYFMDQFHNQNYICDVWKTGLRLNPDEKGLRSRHEIATKIDMLFGDCDIKANALKRKEMAGMSVREFGSSFQNIGAFIDHLKSLR